MSQIGRGKTGLLVMCHASVIVGALRLASMYCHLMAASHVWSGLDHVSCDGSQVILMFHMIVVSRANVLSVGSQF